MSLPYTILDVFTDTPLEGNPLAVVQNADHLTTEQMQAITREFNLSETVFLLEPKHPDLTATLRIFTPGYEMPFAGHPTIGTAALLTLLMESGSRPGRDFHKLDTGVYMLKLVEKIGMVNALGNVLDHRTAQTEFDAPKLPETAGNPGSAGDIARALGLDETQIETASYKPLILSAGVPFTFVPVTDRNALAQAELVHDHWEPAFGSHSHNDAYIYWVDPEAHDGVHIHARMFAPSMGIGEDPATGAAATALAAALVAFDEPAEGWTRYTIEQGRDMGRPSRIGLAIEMEAGTLKTVRISGQSVIIAHGVLEI